MEFAMEFDSHILCCGQLVENFLPSADMIAGVIGSA